MQGTFNIVIQSIKFYKKPVIYQVLIIVLLCAIITGSLLTGRSVKESLKQSASERLGNTKILISSGMRYFSPELVQKLKERSGIICTGMIELNSYCQRMNSQKAAFNTQIIGVNSDFFSFHGQDSIVIKHGEVAVNKKLADYLGIRKGEDLIIRFTQISDIPSDAPFAEPKDAGKSMVVRVGNILGSSQTGNFSLSVSQIEPMNIFINLNDLEEDQEERFKINRLLVRNDNINSLSQVSTALKQCLEPADIGFRIRFIKNTGESELTSDRIFIDAAILNQFINLIPSSAPVITYLANHFDSHKGSTPYSFISGLPASLYPEIVDGNGMIINRWMAHDLSVHEGDTIRMSWYSPDSLNKLIVKNSEFIVRRIVEMEGIWSDSLLMPDFPGISGKESCSDWDAGVPIKMRDIRAKDEDYWNRYRGTPKAFISYEKGKEIWGNNFGPATSVRFPAGITKKEIEDRLNGSMDPGSAGFIIKDIWEESAKAANESVDFGTLFLSLGFFLILSSLLLLSFAVTLYFNSKRLHINVLFAIGFKNSLITKLLLMESVLIGLAGCSIGVFSGYLVNIIITRALNTVWTGAVQTNTLVAYFNFIPVISGFLISYLTIMVLMVIKVRLYLKSLNKKGKVNYKAPSSLKNLYILVISGVVTIILFVFSVLHSDRQVEFSFASGSFLLVTLILLWRQYYLARIFKKSGIIKNTRHLSHLYYSFNPSNAIFPILFIAAGVFTVFITGANRLNFDDKVNKRSGGTGGYLLWCEANVPVTEDLNSESGRKTMGLGDDHLSGMSIVSVKRKPGNDASCLNLNHITTPPLLGIDPDDFIAKNSFSFSKSLDSRGLKNAWQFLKLPAENNIIYGIADQTVLEWGLKLKLGDTLIVRAENGTALKIIIAGGLQPSVFQGNVLIGKKQFSKFYPSVSGNNIFLIDGPILLTELYRSSLTERLENYGINIEKTSDRLASFNKVTNTYLSVFGVFGAFGMIIGVAGLGFVLLRNYNQRKQEFSLLLATGISVRKIRGMIFAEQALVLLAGISTGLVSALVATTSSLKSRPDMPWFFIILILLTMMLTGLLVLFLSVRSITVNSLVSSLRKE
jgi:putative ABC transport system permease protein